MITHEIENIEPVNTSLFKGADKVIFDLMADGVIIRNEIGANIYANQSALRILNLSEDELFERSNFSSKWKTVKEDLSNYPSSEHPANITLNTGNPMNNKIMGVHIGNESYKWISITTSPIKNANEVTGVIVVFRDITEARLAQIEIDTQNEIFNALSKSVSDIVFLLNPNGLITWASQSALRILGKTDYNLLGQKFSKIVFPEDKEVVEKHLNHVKKTPRSTRFTFRAVVNNEIDYFETIVQPVKEKNKKLSHLIAQTRNIGVAKRIEIDLRLKNKELERSNTELSDFAYVASHDLQEPLRMIYSFNKLLEREYGSQLDETGKEYLQYSLNGASKMKLLIDGLLKYAQVNTEFKSLEPVNLRKCSENVLTLLQDQITRINAEIINEIEDIEIVGESVLLERVFQNIIANALKFTMPDKTPKIKLTTQVTKDQVVIVFADNGIGIKPEYFDSIFKIFKKLHTSTDYEGTGLGLAITKRIVENHNGTIWVESSMGLGTRFFISLPHSFTKTDHEK